MKKWQDTVLDTNETLQSGNVGYIIVNTDEEKVLCPDRGFMMYDSREAAERAAKFVINKWHEDGSFFVCAVRAHCIVGNPPEEIRVTEI